MILQGNQRAGATQLGLHLLKDDNDHVEVHEIRGFVSDDVVSAFREAQAISRATKAKQYLYSLSLNPPANEQVSTAQFVKTVDRAEKQLGLNDQPRVIVFHEKLGADGVNRRHCHAVWSRIDTENMKAIQLSYTKRKLQALSKQLYLENGWDMPKGFLDKTQVNKQNFTLAEWQQAKRNNQDPRKIKAALQDAWALADNQQSLQSQLKAKGFALAKGDRRAAVVIDRHLEVHSLAKRTGLKTKIIREKVTDTSTLPSVDEAKQQVAIEMQQRLQTLKEQQAYALNNRLTEIDRKRRLLVEQQKAERSQLKAQQQKRWALEVQQRQARFNQGLKGLVDRFTGQHKRLKQQNELETLQAYQRDMKERDVLAFKQLEQRQRLYQRNDRLEQLKQQKQQALSNEIKEFKVQAKPPKPASVKKPEATVKQSKTQNRIEEFRQQVSTLRHEVKKGR